MNIVVVYDSVFGNTEKIAEAIADELDASLVNVNQSKRVDIEKVDYLIIGSPTHGGSSTDETQKFINSIRRIDGKKFATFDTRSKMKWVKIFGFAAERMDAALRAKGGISVGSPIGFLR